VSADSEEGSSMVSEDHARMAIGAQADKTGSPERSWARVGLWLVASTMVYNVVEAFLALWSGAKAESLALLGFGLDSVIECSAAAVLLWRLAVEARGADRETVEVTERRVRTFVGLTFFALALYVVAQGGWALWRRAHPAESILGIVVASASLVIMPVLSWAKLRTAARIGSAALRSEAKETLACSYLSLTLLLGLVANAKLGWWWADPVAALLMVPWLFKEGLEGVSDEDEDDRPGKV
jgi:divalent metal cation (Fe/Co/Zn/Cd) transporter